MPNTIHAQLDDETDAKRRDLERRLGWDDSRLVEEGIRLLAVVVGGQGKRKIIGQGAFESTVSDLGSNPRHLDGFGH